MSIPSDRQPLIRAENDDDQSSSTVTERGDDHYSTTCCLGMSRPSIILRNILIPKHMWEEFPRGLDLSISDQFIYQPGYPFRVNQASITKPSVFKMPYEEVWIKTQDNVDLYAFLIKQSSTYPTLIFFHGNAGSIGDRLENAKILYQTLKLNILLVEYRGYGPSTGTPSEKGLYLDASAAFDYVEKRQDLDPKNIFVFGRSLGGAVAIQLCTREGIRDRVAGLIVENTFTSVPSVAKKIFAFPGVRYLPRWFYSNKFDSKSRVKALKCPSFFISSQKDEMLPPEMMFKLFTLCGAFKKNIVCVSAGHNDAYLCPEYTSLLHTFIQGVVGKDFKLKRSSSVEI